MFLPVPVAAHKLPLKVQLADWTDDRVYSTAPLNAVTAPVPRPTQTGCPRRWPDVRPSWPAITDVEMLDTCTLVDRDLRDVVTRVYDLYHADPTVDNEWTLANTIDAAVDEQDRRRGWAPRAPRPCNGPTAPMQFEQFVYGAGINFKRRLPADVVVFAQMLPPTPRAPRFATLRRVLYAAAR